MIVLESEGIDGKTLGSLVRKYLDIFPVLILKRYIDQELLERCHTQLEALNAIPEDLALNEDGFCHFKSFYPEKSTARYIHHTFKFNSMFLGRNRALAETFDKLKSLYGLIVPNEYSYLGTGRDEQFGLSPEVIHYPSGGGFFSEHVHEQYPQGYGLILNGSYSNDSFECGGVYFRTSDGIRFDFDGVSEIGDVVIFDYGLRHGVSRIDPRSDFTWSLKSGRISYVLPLKRNES